MEQKDRFCSLSMLIEQKMKFKIQNLESMALDKIAENVKLRKLLEALISFKSVAHVLTGAPFSKVPLLYYLFCLCIALER